MFLYTYPNLYSCELLMPKASITRSNSITLQYIDRCSYLVSNVTTDDQGIWIIKGVGPIMYKTAMAVTVTS